MKTYEIDDSGPIIIVHVSDGQTLFFEKKQQYGTWTLNSVRDFLKKDRPDLIEKQN